MTINNSRNIYTIYNIENSIRKISSLIAQVNYVHSSNFTGPVHYNMSSRMKPIPKQSCPDLYVWFLLVNIRLCIYGVAILFCMLKFTINLLSMTNMLLICLASASLLPLYPLLTRAHEDKCPL